MNQLPNDLQTIIYKYKHQLDFTDTLNKINDIEYQIFDLDPLSRYNNEVYHSHRCFGDKQTSYKWYGINQCDMDYRNRENNCLFVGCWDYNLWILDKTTHISIEKY